MQAPVSRTKLLLAHAFASVPRERAGFPDRIAAVIVAIWIACALLLDW